MAARQDIPVRKWNSYPVLFPGLYLQMAHVRLPLNTCFYAYIYQLQSWSRCKLYILDAPLTSSDCHISWIVYLLQMRKTTYSISWRVVANDRSFFNRIFEMSPRPLPAPPGTRLEWSPWWSSALVTSCAGGFRTWMVLEWQVLWNHHKSQFLMGKSTIHGHF